MADFASVSGISTLGFTEGQGERQSCNRDIMQFPGAPPVTGLFDQHALGALRAVRCKHTVVTLGAAWKFLGSGSTKAFSRHNMLLAFKDASQVPRHCIPDVHDVLVLGVRHAHNVLIVVAEGHSPPLPPLNLVAELSQQLEGGILMQHC